MTEEELLAAGYRKYCGETIDIFFKAIMCQHAGNCVRGHGRLFNLKRRPWIKVDEASPEEVVCVIDSCPSGALKYIRR